MSEKHDFMVEVLSDLPGMDDPDRQGRLVSMLVDVRRIGPTGRYVDRLRREFQIARIHFTDKVLDDTTLASSDIVGIDDVRFDREVRIYLENEEGGLTGWEDARAIGATTASPVEDDVPDPGM